MLKKLTNPAARVIGIDIGGTGIKGGIVDLDAGVVIGERFRVDTPRPSTPAAVATAVKEVVEELMARENAPTLNSPVGITFPAIIDRGWLGRLPTWIVAGSAWMWSPCLALSWAGRCTS